MNTSFVRGLHNLRVDSPGTVATIGTFDGIHRGHQAILAQVRERARMWNLPSVTVIFEPQPQEFFSQEQAPARLLRMREKVEAILAVGIDQVLCLQFNKHLCSLTADAFIRQVLVDGLGVRCLVVGDDFRFGCDRLGDYERLVEAGSEFGFEVENTQTVLYRGERISSTRIRKLLEKGEFDGAAELLGRPYAISGRVVHGQRLGAQLGIPTANVNLQRYRAPVSGVFIVEVMRGGERLPGVANVGVRPTVGDMIKPLLEVHLLNWQGDLYGERIAVEFKRKIRDEQNFGNLEQLVAAIRADIEIAKRYFSDNRPGPRHGLRA